MSSPEYELASFVSDISIKDVPEAVRDEASLLVADTVGATVGGVTLPEVQSFATTVAERNPGETTIFGTAHTAAPSHAALVNGVTGTVLELNAGHKYAAGHPVVHLFPAIVAEAEVADTAGSEFLSAFVAGYEACTRAARACEPLASEYLPHGVWGSVGAAAAIARLRGFDANTTLATLRIAANFAQHTRFEAVLEGATGVRNGPVGVSNFCGIVAANLAESGFTGLDDGIELHLDRTARDGFQSDVLADRLGSHWELSRGYYKMHAAGRLVHPAIDGAARLQERYGFESDDVTSVRVETYEKAARWLGGTAPTNWLQAKSSVPFAVATRLVNESSGRAAFDESAFTEEVMNLTERVSVHADDEFTSWVPERRSARVTIELATGERHSELVTHARGGAEDPYSEAELRRKFIELVHPVLGDGAATTLWEAARNLPETTPKRMCRLVRTP